jgi:ABC-type phosphonate transport system ATPase subunit
MSYNSDKPYGEYPSAQVIVPEPAMSINAEHLAKNYGPIRAMDDISFRIKWGEVFGSQAQTSFCDTAE